jgi:hypothetical protein
LVGRSPEGPLDLEGQSERRVSGSVEVPDGFEQCLTDRGRGAGNLLHTIVAAGLDGGLQILQISETRPAILQVTFQLAAVLDGQFTVEIFRERSEEMFAVWVSHPFRVAPGGTCPDDFGSPAVRRS